MENNVYSENLKLASSIANPESTVRIDNLSDDLLLDNLVNTEAKNKYNREVEALNEKLDKNQELLDKYAEQFKDSMQNLEIMPLYRYCLITTFDINPFQTLKRDSSGIITDLGGFAPQYKSNETGEWEEEESYIGVGLVVEVGPECKYLKVGDVVMFKKESAFPVPFYNQGFHILDEQRVSVVINENLHSRLNKNND